MCSSAVRVVFLVGLLVAPATARGGEESCDEEFPSTFALLQKRIFEDRGCTSALCHDGSASGGLDLRGDAAYDALVEHDAESVSGWLRVKPGRKDDSLLYVNLAAATLPDSWSAPLRSMPQGGLRALNFDELEAVRLWIEDGAPRDGVVVGTGELLRGCLPPAEPIKIAPLPPPAPGEGVQLHMPAWTLTPQERESEVCFTSYYDFTGQIPEQYLNEDGTKFRFSRNEIRQDPVSHHLIVNLYTGTAPPNSGAWGTYRCRGGEHDGEFCEPTDLDGCGEGQCATAPVRAVACTGYGPADAQLGIASGGVTVSQETAADNRFVDGVYDELPLRGLIVWNSHAFNLTDVSANLEAWVNFYFAENQETPLQRIFGTPGSIFDFAVTLFKTNAPAFGTDEVCELYVLPPNAHLFELSSHTHKRGKRFRIFQGAFTCQGGPNDGDACTPYGPDLASPDLCLGSPCAAVDGPEVGDCNGDHTVRVDELVLATGIALGKTGPAACPRSDGDGDGRTSIDDLIGAVAGAMNGFPHRDPDEALLYTNVVYDDPLVLRYEPPMVLTASPVFPDERTLTYCSLYDNGFTDPETVKRRLTSPVPPLPAGGPCNVPTGCVSGRVSEACSGNDQDARDASCDSTAEAGDGFCDACPLRGGVTTEDEMFLIMGAYYLP